MHALSHCSPPVLAPANAADLQKQIDSLAKPLIADGTAVGFVVGVMQNGKTRFLSYGETAKGSRIAPNPDTVYEIGSVTKVFTCHATGRHGRAGAGQAR